MTESCHHSDTYYWADRKLTRVRAMEESVSAVIVGGGPAGVATSYFLQQSQIAHIVLERDRAFSEWYKRWDSFHMNTANWMNSLPGATEEFAAGASRDALGSKVDALYYFESTLAAVNPPISEFTEVTSVRQAQHDTWVVATTDSTYETANVVICTGILRNPKIPSVAVELPVSISQLHSSEYRNPKQINSGRVFVVGSGNSGVQICEDLARSGKFGELTLAVSGNWTIPLEILGIPIYTLMRWFHLMDLKPNSWLGRKFAPAGKGDPTIPPSPKQLVKKYGIELVGKVSGLGQAGIRCSNGRTVTLEDLSVVWCTGFQARYDFIEPLNRDGVFDTAGQPVHERGLVTAAPGLYFVGLRFQSTVTSQSIYGMVRDAQYVAQHVATNKPA